MHEGKMWLTCLRSCCMAHACSLGRRKSSALTIYKAIHSARTTIKTRGKEVGIQLTLKNCQEKESEVISE